MIPDFEESTKHYYKKPLSPLLSLPKMFWPIVLLWPFGRRERERERKKVDVAREMERLGLVTTADGKSEVWKCLGFCSADS